MSDSPQSSGIKALITCPALHFISELVFGCLVCILVALSLASIPLVQGWVMFVSVSSFIGTTVLFFMYMCGAHVPATLDAVYHCIAFLFYLSASVLEAFAAISKQSNFTYEQYIESAFAMMFLCLNTLLYMCHAMMSGSTCLFSHMTVTLVLCNQTPANHPYLLCDHG
uniref:Myelin and lymphocyte protein n=1 Tax=Equus caballus TaxID=9796 RepID=A0A9L0T2S5_HORSE